MHQSLLYYEKGGVRETSAHNVPPRSPKLDLLLHVSQLGGVVVTGYSRNMVKKIVLGHGACLYVEWGSHSLPFFLTIIFSSNFFQAINTWLNSYVCSNSWGEVLGVQPHRSLPDVLLVGCQASPEIARHRPLYASCSLPCVVPAVHSMTILIYYANRLGSPYRKSSP